MRAHEPWSGVIIDPREMVGSMYKEDQHTLLHTNMKVLGLVVLKEFFYVFSHDAPGAWPEWTPVSDPWGGAVYNPRGMIGKNTCIIVTNYFFNYM